MSVERINGPSLVRGCPQPPTESTRPSSAIFRPGDIRAFGGITSTLRAPGLWTESGPAASGTG
jgi:hypothetical protein